MSEEIHQQINREIAALNQSVLHLAKLLALHKPHEARIRLGLSREHVAVFETLTTEEIIQVAQNPVFIFQPRVTARQIRHIMDLVRDRKETGGAGMHSLAVLLRQAADS